MKKSTFYVLTILLSMVSCNNESSIDQEQVTSSEEMYPIQFGIALKKDVINFPKTRSMPTLDVPEPVISKSETDPSDPTVTELQDLCSQIEYIVYKNEDGTPSLFKQKHYTSNDLDFGIVYDTLPHGEYQFHFLAHSSEQTSLSGFELTFDKVSDTFHQTINKTIEPAEIISEDITLNRIVSKIEFKATDPIPAELKRFDITITGWPEALNLQNGKGVTHTTPRSLSYAFTPEEIGKEGNIHSFYTFLPPEAGTLSAQLEAFDQNELLIRKRTVNNIQPEINKIIQYNGRLYSRSETDNTFQLSIFENGAWTDTTTVDLPEYD